MRTHRRKENLVLLATAAVLLALSLFTYFESVSRAERFERGQRFLPNLDLDEVGALEIRRQEDRVILERSPEGNRFRVKNAQGYRADTAKVNRLLRDLLDLGLEKEVGRATESLSQELQVARLEGGALPADTLEIALLDGSGQDMVRFLLGKRHEDGAGRYVRRVPPPSSASSSSSSSSSDAVEAEAPPSAGAPRGTGEIYITDGDLRVDTEPDAWLDQEILDLPEEEIRALRGDGFEIARTEPAAQGDTEADAASELGPLELQEPEGEASGKVGSVKRVVSPLRFTRHHLADAPEVQGLVFDRTLFDRTLEVELTDGSAYRLELATRGDQHFLRVDAFHTQNEVYLDREASEDEVRETSEILLRADEIQAFRDYHGSWIYEVTETTAERIGVEASELVE